MQHKILYRYLPIFLFVLVVCCVPMRAAAAVGVGFVWDGDVSVIFPDPFMYIDYTYKSVEFTDGTNTKPYSVEAYHHADQNVRICIDSDYSDCFLNGSIGLRVTVNASPSASNYVDFILTPYCEPIVLDDVFATIDVISRGFGTCTFDILLEFNNYYIDQTEFSVPLNIQYDLNGYYNTQTDASLESFYCTFDIVEDYHGTIMGYDKLEDVPSTDGYIAGQNQTIIDQSQTQNNLTTEQNSLIQNQTQQQHSDSQAEINQSIQNTDQITNGYNSSQMGDAENKFESGAGDLNDIEDSLIDSSSGYVDSFTSTGFDTSFLQSVGPSLNYVVTWFTNFWNMGGALTSTYGLSFAIFIAFYILRVRG